MPKGMFTQGFCLLTDGQTSIADVRAALESAGYRIAKEVPGANEPSFSGPSVVIPFREDCNGYVAVDVVARPWPDSMGHPQSDPMTFGAWSMGHFGPFAYPGGLSRAVEHCWTWPEGRQIAPAHRGFVRMRISYVFGADDHATIVPQGYDPLPELLFLSRLTIAALRAPGVLCYFNPNGEVLRDARSFEAFHRGATEAGKIPLQLWSNARFYKLNASLAFMDTVGNAQFDRRDVEAVFPLDEYDPGAVGFYLANVSHYLLESGKQLQSGEPIDGPGENNLSWLIDVCENGLVSPPRRTVRLFPRVHGAAVRAALGGVAAQRS